MSTGFNLYDAKGLWGRGADMSNLLVRAADAGVRDYVVYRTDDDVPDYSRHVIRSLKLFRDVKAGEQFLQPRCTDRFLRLARDVQTELMSDGAGWNVVSLESGCFVYFRGDDPVHPIMPIEFRR